MGIMGFVFGILIGAGLIAYVGVNGFSYPGMDEMAGRFNMPDRIYQTIQMMPLLLGPSIVLVGSFLASLYPAIRLHWLEPVQAMRAA